jgi:hypothetical protein
MAGHGQHAASAIIAGRAFKITGNKMQYTEQLHTYDPWQPKRILLNTYRFGDRNTTSEDQFKLAVGQYIPTLGMGVGELAGLSRSIHKSQGAGTPSVPGIQTEYFKLVDGDSLSQSLFDGIDITWGRVGVPEIGNDLKQIELHFDFMHPDASIPALLAVRSKIEDVQDNYWRKEKLEEIDRTILDCTGLLAELYTKQPQAVKGAVLPFTLRVIARSATPVLLNTIQWSNADTLVRVKISDDTLRTFEHTIGIPASTPITQPYWLTVAHLQGQDLFNIPNDTLIGLPETPNNLNATLLISIGGTEFAVKVPLSYKKLDPVKGDIVEQLRVVPDATLKFNSTLLVTNPDGSVHAEVNIHTNKEIKDGTLTISGKTDVAVIKGLNLAANTDTIIPVSISGQNSAAQGKDDYYLTAALEAGGNTYNQAQYLIQYNHLPTLQYFTSAYTKVIRANWKCTVRRIGYIEGAGDFIPSLLRQAGLEVDVLKENELTNAAKLKKYDAIITGIRSVNVEKRMAYWLPVLFEYAKNGGTLVMQYNTTQELSTTKLGPYPFTLASDLRVTEEDAKITLLDPKHRILNYPNKITDDDFNGWVQERGLYFASKWDDKYTPLFSMHDEGEQPLSGGTLYTKYGKGNYVYTSLSFFRQLPVGNKGAIRLLMNMLSVGK